MHPTEGRRLSWFRKTDRDRGDTAGRLGRTKLVVVVVVVVAVVFEMSMI